MESLSLAPRCQLRAGHEKPPQITYRKGDLRRLNYVCARALRDSRCNRP